MRLRLFVVAAMIIGTLMLVLAPLGFAQVWLWLALLGAGALAALALRRSTELDQRSSDTISAGEFRRAVNLGGFLDKGLRDRVAEAIRIWQDCESLVDCSGRVGLDAYLAEKLVIVRESVMSVYDLASHLNSYRRSPVSTRELAALSDEIQELEQQLETTRAPEIRAELDRHLKTKLTLLSSQRSLASTMAQASLQLDSTLALLKALDAQMRTALVASDGYVAGVQEVADELEREIKDLQQTQQVLAQFRPLALPPGGSTLGWSLRERGPVTFLKSKSRRSKS